MRLTYLSLPLLLAGMIGCAPDSEESLAIHPAAPTVRVGEHLSIQAQPLEDLTEPEWEIAEPHGGGFLRSRGLNITYVAPQAAGTYRLVARAKRADGSNMKQVVEVVVLPLLRIEPAAPVVAQGGSINLSANTRGLAKNTVTWSVEANGGSISSEGVYTAPRAKGVYHVQATSTLDPNLTATVSVRVE